MFIAIAISSEVVLHYSRKSSSFNIRLTSGGDLSRAKQFIKSFGPSIIFAPLFLWFTSTHEALKLIRPYVDMEKKDVGTGVPLWSIALNQGPRRAFREYVSRRHWVITILSLIAILSGLFSSLAGAYFQIVPKSEPIPVNLNISGRVRTDYTAVNNLFVPFVSAAGNIDVALRDNDFYSPNLYVDGDNIWMIPPFKLVDSGSSDHNGTLLASLSAVKVQARCAGITRPNITVLPPGRSFGPRYYLVGRLGNNCSASLYASANKTSPWYPWAAKAFPGCVQAINPNETETNGVDQADNFFYPIAISFFKDNSTVSMAFCYSTLTEYTVDANITFSNGNNRGINGVRNPRNATSLGFGPSGLWYNTTSDEGTVQGIGDAIAFVLGDAVVQYAGYSNDSSANVSTLQDRTLSNPSLVAAIAQKAYVRYQALVAPLTLVDGSSYQTPATYYIGVYRLLAIGPVAHALTALSAITGFALLVLFSHHRIIRPHV